MRALRIWLSIAVALTIQTSLSAFLARHGVSIDVVALVVMYFGLTAGPESGLLAGAVGGLGQDALSGGILGVGGLVKTVVGFGAGVVGSQFIVTGLLPRFVVLVAGTALDVLGFLGLSAALGAQQFAISYGQVLRHALTTGLVGVLMFWALERAPEAVRRRRMRSRLL